MGDSLAGIVRHARALIRRSIAAAHGLCGHPRVRVDHETAGYPGDRLARALAIARASTVAKFAARAVVVRDAAVAAV